MSITLHPMWPRLATYLVVEKYDKDGGHLDPRIRIELRDLPPKLAHEASFVQIACVACQRPINPLRHREGDDWTRLYYAPACPVTTRAACSRGGPAHEEYERFKTLCALPSYRSRQLEMFGQ